MGSTGADEIPRGDVAEGSETTIEIKIKTLDSQTYTLRVNKQMPVPVLKEQIASVTGVLSEQQRLICRGKVLKDDQLLSAYHVEDGHTLHLVVRQPVPPASEGLPNHPGDPASSASRGQGNQAAPRVVIEAFNMPDQGEGVPPEISRIVSAVLGSFGISSFGSGSEGVDVREHGTERLERTLGADSTQLQPEQAGIRFQPDRSRSTFGLPTAISLGPLQPPVIPDSLTTLSHYLSHMRHEFGANGRGNNAQAAASHRTQEREYNPTSHSGIVQEGLPTPASLAEVMLSARQMLIEQAGEHLFQLARQLENQANVTDPSLRLSTQSSAWNSGVLLQNLGAFLLELGRATMTLRLGQTPSEAIVNAGPAVFISPSGPNPLMVQPLPFQPGASFGPIPTGHVQPGSGLFTGLGTGLRHIDIQIRRGSSAATPTVNQQERGNSQQPSEQRNPGTSSGGENIVNQETLGVSEGPSSIAESGVRVVPIRTMVATVPGPFSRLPSDSTSGSLGLYYPVLGRFQHVASGQVTERRESQASGETFFSGFQTEHVPIPESAMQQQNFEDPAGDGSLPAPNLRQQEPSHSRSFNISVLSTGGTQNNQESDTEIPSSVVQFLRTLFPGGEIHVDDASIQGAPTGSVTEHEGTASGAVDAQEAGVTDEGIFLSNLLCQIMPLISQNGESNDTHSEEANVPEHGTAQNSSAQAENSDVGTSRRESSLHTDPPNSKRQKKE
ncbi:hypothetical protein L1049_001475 [Liquidambar formosana]|uniref:Ubiquitin-like domain-containing protein n=1 Tax=Liquidambar formosana TaxID=63359 RepID=A0AAP0R4B6_LIQFO